MNEYSSTYYFRPADRKPKTINFARYVHRAKAVKHNDPQGVYAVFNLSNNKGFSSKPTLDKDPNIYG